MQHLATSNGAIYSISSGLLDRHYCLELVFVLLLSDFKRFSNNINLQLDLEVTLCLIPMHLRDFLGKILLAGILAVLVTVFFLFLIGIPSMQG